MQWFYIRNGQRTGPVEEAELFRLAREGALAPDDLVWNPAMGQEWKPAATIPQLFAAPATGVPAVPGATHNRDLMRTAREALQGRWALAVGAALLYQVVIGGVQFVPYLGPLVVLVISGPMVLGFNRFFLKMARRDSPDVGQLFDGFKLFGKALGTYALICVFMFLWMLPMMASGIFAAIAIPLIAKESALGLLLVPVFVLLGIAGILLIVRAALAYSQTFYILSDHPETPASEAIRQSKQMMVGFKWKLFCLPWRFFWWGLLCFLTCFIGFLWLYPYLAASHAAFYDDIRTR